MAKITDPQIVSWYDRRVRHASRLKQMLVFTMRELIDEHTATISNRLTAWGANDTLESSSTHGAPIVTKAQLSGIVSRLEELIPALETNDTVPANATRNLYLDAPTTDLDIN